MTRFLKVKVQADRWPSGKDGVVLLGLRLSAVVQPDAADPTVPTDLPSILPWHWTRARAVAPAGDDPVLGAFPQEPDDWAVIRIRSGQRTAVASRKVLQARTPDAQFVVRMTEVAAEIVGAVGAAAALNEPNSGEISSRTVFGLVESLTSLPQPLPQWLGVWTAFEIDGDVADTDVYIAVPLFNAGGFTAGSFDPAQITEPISRRFRVPYDGGTTVAEVAASRPRAQVSLKAVEPHARRGRVIDIDSLEILPDPVTPPITSLRDDAVELPSLVSSVIDPIYNIIAAAPGATRAWVDAAQGDEERAARRRTLDRDLRSPNSIVQGFLRAIAWPRIRPTIFDTEGGVSVALSLLTHAWKSGKPGEAAFAILVDLMERDRRGEPVPLLFHLLGSRRLSAAAGIFPDEVDTKSTEPIPFELDDEKDFVAWLHDRWTSAATGPEPLPVGARRVCLLIQSIVDSPRTYQPQPGNGAGTPLINAESLRAGVAARASLGVHANPGSVLSIQIISDSQVMATFDLSFSDTELQIAVAGTVTATLPHSGGRINASLTWRISGDRIEVLLRAKKDVLVADARVYIPADDVSRGLHVEFSATGADLPDLRLGAADEDRVLVREWLKARKESSVAWRHAISLAVDSAFIPKIVEAQAASADLPTRLVEELKERLVLQYDEFRTMIPAENLLDELLRAILEAAQANARDATQGIFVDPVEDSRTTPKAAPIVLRVDQYQSFAGDEDLWKRLAGIGMLLGRSETPEHSDSWYTLNAADVFMRRSDGRVAVTTNPGSTTASRVDPIPLQITETAGVRAANMIYENRSLVASMPGDATLEAPPASGTTVVPTSRRVEEYEFSRTGTGRGSRLPALVSGQHFHFLPYLIGMGGVLPVWLRGTDAVTPLGTVGSASSFELPKALIDGLAQSHHYLRTTPIGAPRLASQLHTLPQGVSPLAAELPIEPAPFTMLPGHRAWFYRDPRQRGGVLSFGGAGRRLVRVDIESLPDGGTLEIEVFDKSADALLKVTLETVGLRGSGARLDVSGISVALALLDRRDRFAEDEPNRREMPAASFKIDRIVDTAKWGNFAIRLGWIGQEQTCGFPVASTGLRWSSDDLPPEGASHEEARGLQRHLPPEAAQQGRTVVLLDGFLKPSGIVPTSVQLRLRPPQTDFGTFERWLNWPNSPGVQWQRNRDLVDAAQKFVTDAGAESEGDRTLDDPAITGMRYELHELFPERAERGAVELPGQFPHPSKTAPAFDAMRVKVEAANAPATLASDAATLRPGCVYELRIYGMLSRIQPAISGAAVLDRLDPAVKSGLLQRTDAHVLSAPLTLTFEVTCHVPAKLDALFGQPLLDFSEVERPTPDPGHGKVRPDNARIRFNAAHPANVTPLEWYRTVRIFSKATLSSQRWSWRGRPMTDDLGVLLEQQRGGIRGWAELEDKEEVAIPFAGRRIDDVGVILPVPLTKGHAYGGAPNFGGGRVAAVDPVLFERDLDYRGGANLWRFGLKLTSRYAPLNVLPSSEERYTYRNSGGGSSWTNFLLADRPTARQIKRPGVSLVIPLTEPMMRAGSVPPLLCLLNETSFDNFNIAERFEAAVDMARHPLPEDGQPKFYAQWGYDPIRTAVSPDGEPLPLRADGPIGYTFDAETEAGRFDHSAWLVSPVLSRVRPWSMIRLRFRRWEEPLMMDQAERQSPDQQSIGEWRLSCPITNLDNQTPGVPPVVGERLVRLESQGLGAPQPSGAVTFLTQHEGLCVEGGQLKDGQEIELGVAFLKGRAQESKVDRVSTTVKLTATGVNRKMTVQTRSEMGTQKAWELEVKGDAHVSLRLVIAARAIPAQGEKLYQPAADVSVWIRVDRTGRDSIARPEEGLWFSVSCMPLLGDVQHMFTPGEPLTVDVWGRGLGGGPSKCIRPIRLSGFTAPLWCQFSEDMSALSCGTEVIPVEQLTARRSGDSVVFGRGMGALTEPLGVQVATDESSQVEDILLVVVTGFASDAFSRIRERPFFIAELDASGTGCSEQNPLWADPSGWKPGPPATRGGPIGRVRFMRVLRMKKSVAGSAHDLKEMLFGSDPFEAVGEDLDMNPSDVTGMTLGISRPIDLR